MKITIFSEELRKCLNAAGLSDCGENDTWNYWYQRLMNAFNESVERQIMTEQTENAKLRDLATYALRYIERERCDDPKHELWHGKPCESCAEAGSSDCPKIMAKMFGELGIEEEQ